MSPGLLTPRDKAQRKQRRAKQMFTASSVIVFLPALEFIGMHESFLDIVNPKGFAHLATLLLGALGMLRAQQIRREGVSEEAEVTEPD